MSVLFIRAKKREDWEIPDPKNLSSEDFPIVRDQIEKRVIAILNNLDAPKT